MKNKVNEALGLMNDSHIAEAANYQKTRWGWIPAAAAVLALVIAGGALGLYFMDDGRPPLSLDRPIVNTTESVTKPSISTETAIPTEPTITEGTVPVPTGATIWGYGGETMGVPKDFGKLGVVCIYRSVIDAMERVEHPEDVLAVYVQDVEQATDQEVYERVLKPMGVTDEAFVENGYTFLTKEQILTMECPEDMAICVDMKDKSIALTRAYVESTDQEFFYVEGGIHRLSEDVKEGHTLYPGYEEDPEQRKRMWNFWSERNAQRLQALFDYLGLEDWVIYDMNSSVSGVDMVENHGHAGFGHMNFRGTMSREQVMRLLEAMETGSYGEVWAVETEKYGGWISEKTK